MRYRGTNHTAPPAQRLSTSLISLLHRFVGHTPSTGRMGRARPRSFVIQREQRHNNTAMPQQQHALCAHGGASSSNNQEKQLHSNQIYAHQVHIRSRSVDPDRRLNGKKWCMYFGAFLNMSCLLSDHC